MICLTLCLLSARWYRWVCCLLHCVSCVTLPYAEAVARLNAMMLSSYLEKERKMNTVCWYCDAAYVWTLLLPTSYCLRTLSQLHTYTMMLGLDTPRGEKVVWRCAPIPANKNHHIHTHTHTHMLVYYTLQYDTHIPFSYTEHVLLVCYLVRTISYIRDHITWSCACLWSNGRVGRKHILALDP